MENNLFEKVSDFLKRSSECYNDETQRQIRDLESFQGDFWTADLKKKYARTKKSRLALHFSDWQVLANAIQSPFSNSPWHTALVENNTIQDRIDEIESDNDYKAVMKQATLRQIVAGSGYVYVTPCEDEKIVVDFIQNQSSVAFDPDIETVDGSDAEEGAIVTYMSLNKAKRLFGEDIVPTHYPRATMKIDFNQIDMWQNQINKIQVINYYCKNESGTVSYYKICGNKVVTEATLPISYIPIVRFAGYQHYSKNKAISYSGIVSKTYSLQLGLNIAYSTLIERANRSIKASLIASTDSVEGLNQYYQKMSDEDGMMILYNKGTSAPTPLVEQFQTGDLSDVINNTRNLIADVIGVPLAGIIGINEKTATEVMIQQTNQQSNVSHFYDNAYVALRTISRIIIQMCNDGQMINFELENGPDIITNNMKKKQELAAVANLLPQEMQPILAVHMTDTMLDRAESLKNDIIANLPASLTITKETEDPVAIHAMNQMKATLDNTMSELEAKTEQLVELKKQYETLELELLNRKQEQLIEFEKWKAEFALKQVETGHKVENDNAKNNIQLIKELDVAKRQLIEEMGNVYAI